MRDEIFWGNLIGLLKTGKWSLSVSEAGALLQIIAEAEKRSRPLALNQVEVQEPIKEKKKNGNK